MEMHEAGGGMEFTVKHAKKSAEKELLKGLKERLKAMKRVGTTLVEVKVAMV